MPSIAEIQSRALNELGETAVQAIDPNADEEISAAAARIYPSVRDELLYSYPWSWSLKREKLRQSNLEPDEQPRYEFKFEPPAGLSNIGQIRAFYTGPEDTREPEVSGWTREGNFIYSVWEEAWLEYQVDIGEEAYPALFVSALIPFLAARYCQLIVEDPAIARFYRQLAEDAAATARRVDSQSKPPESMGRLGYIDARFGYGGRRLAHRYR